MATTYYAVVTEQGNAAIANAILLGKKVNVTAFAIGDAGGNYYAPTGQETKLKNEVWRGNVQDYSIDTLNRNVLKISTIVPSDVGGFTMREMGLFDENNNLIAIANCPAMEKIVLGEGIVSEFVPIIKIAVSNTAIINFKVDPTAIVAIKADIKEAIVKHNADEEDTHIDIRKNVEENAKQIGDLKGDTVGLGFGSSCVQLNTVGVTDIHEIAKTPYRRCFGLDLTNAPSKGFYFYDIMVHSVGYATVTATGFGEGEAIKRTFTNELINGRWEGWKDPEGEIKVLQNRNYIPSVDENTLERDKATVPTDYIHQFKVTGLKNRTVMGLTGGGYVHPLGINSWTDESASAYELMFTHDGFYYRKSNSPTEWGKPMKIATGEKIDIVSRLMGGWQVVDSNCSIEGNIIDGVLFVNGLIKNNGESSACIDLSQYPPKDGKWHGGSAISGNGNAKYFVIDPHGSTQFQTGYEKGQAYTINFNYRVY